MVQQISKRWDVNEIAFILNYSDYCQKFGLDYEATIRDDFLQIKRTDGAKRQNITVKQIKDKLYKIFKLKPPVDVFLKQGSRAFDSRRLPPAWLQEMNAQRKDWRLAPLKTPRATSVRVVDPIRSSPVHQVQKKEQSTRAAFREQKHPSPSEPNPENISNRDASIEDYRMMLAMTDHQSNPNSTISGNVYSGSRTTRDSRQHVHPNTVDTPASSAVAHLATSTANTLGALQSRLDLLNDTVCWLLGRIVSLRGETPDLLDLMKSIKSTIQHEPERALGRLADDLIAMDESKCRYRNMVYNLIGKQDYLKNASLVEDTDLCQLNENWRAFRTGLFDALQPGSPSGSPTVLPAGYLAGRIDDLLDGSFAAPIQFEWSKNILSLLATTHELQTFLSALLCKWVFESPDPMCADQHPCQTLKLYEVLSLTAHEGVAQVERLDFIGTKLLFNDTEFQKNVLPARARRLIAQLSEIIEFSHLPVCGLNALNDPEAWLVAAIQLRQSLMLSSNDYRIHYCLPGIAFDPSWMRAEDIEGFPVEDEQGMSMRVGMCLFPALAQQPKEPRANDRGSQTHPRLTSRKQFFPSPMERRSFSSGNVVCKAVVLVE